MKSEKIENIKLLMQEFMHENVGKLDMWEKRSLRISIENMDEILSNIKFMKDARERGALKDGVSLKWDT
jgi:hypothetical protein